MAYKVFSNGDALTGGELNTFLMNQSVISFASVAARNAALPAPLEGQLVWLEDSNKYVYYTGSAWTDLVTPVNTNQILNGAFDIWQRGTSFSAPASANTFSADRFKHVRDGAASTATISQQSFTPGSAPVAPYESSFFLRYDQTVAGTGSTFSTLEQAIEGVRTLAGQTATLSFWAKANASRTISTRLVQGFGSGGSARTDTLGSNITLTTSWSRYTQTFTVPSVAGKTIGAGDLLLVEVDLPLNQTMTLDFWGFQLEAGSNATGFKTNSSNIEAELSACQRFYYKPVNTGTSFGTVGTGWAVSTTSSQIFTQFPVSMRTQPTAVESSTLLLSDGVGTTTVTTITLDTNISSISQAVTIVSGVGQTQYRPMYLRQNSSGAGFLAFSAEL